MGQQHHASSRIRWTLIVTSRGGNQSSSGSNEVALVSRNQLPVDSPVVHSQHRPGITTPWAAPRRRWIQRLPRRPARRPHLLYQLASRHRRWPSRLKVLASAEMGAHVVLRSVTSVNQNAVTLRRASRTNLFQQGVQPAPDATGRTPPPPAAAYEDRGHLQASPPSLP